MKIISKENVESQLRISNGGHRHDKYSESPLYLPFKKKLTFSPTYSALKKNRRYYLKCSFWQLDKCKKFMIYMKLRLFGNSDLKVETKVIDDFNRTSQKNLLDVYKSFRHNRYPLMKLSVEENSYVVNDDYLLKQYETVLTLQLFKKGNKKKFERLSVPISFQHLYNIYIELDNRRICLKTILDEHQTSFMNTPNSLDNVKYEKCTEFSSFELDKKIGRYALRYSLEGYPLILQDLKFVLKRNGKFDKHKSLRKISFDWKFPRDELNLYDIDVVFQSTSYKIEYDMFMKFYYITGKSNRTKTNLAEVSYLTKSSILYNIIRMKSSGFYFECFIKIDSSMKYRKSANVIITSPNFHVYLENDKLISKFNAFSVNRCQINFNDLALYDMWFSYIISYFDNQLLLFINKNHVNCIRIDVPKMRYYRKNKLHFGYQSMGISFGPIILRNYDILYEKRYLSSPYEIDRFTTTTREYKFTLNNNIYWKWILSERIATNSDETKGHIKLNVFKFNPKYMPFVILEDDEQDASLNLLGHIHNFYISFWLKCNEYRLHILRTRHLSLSCGGNIVVLFYSELRKDYFHLATKHISEMKNDWVYVEIMFDESSTLSISVNNEMKAKTTRRYKKFEDILKTIQYIDSEAIADYKRRLSIFGISDMSLLSDYNLFSIEQPLIIGQSYHKLLKSASFELGNFQINLLSYSQIAYNMQSLIYGDIFPKITLITSNDFGRVYADKPNITYHYQSLLQSLSAVNNGFTVRVHLQWSGLLPSHLTLFHGDGLKIMYNDFLKTLNITYCAELLCKSSVVHGLDLNERWLSVDVSQAPQLKEEQTEDKLVIQINGNRIVNASTEMQERSLKEPTPEFSTLGETMIGVLSRDEKLPSSMHVIVWKLEIEMRTLNWILSTDYHYDLRLKG
ncbi:hypothetical protein SNEBB_010432 [Seison nebaliae]|nr:hypothetical protein SNEBB_010432 [Seison nebaliae]